MQRNTHQKKLILDILNNLSHPNAYDIYNEARKINPKISVATIYRNLNQLVLDKKITKLNLDNLDSIYDINTHSHNHFVCTKCKKIIDVKPILIDEQELENTYGFKVANNHLTINGLCFECKMDS